MHPRLHAHRLFTYLVLLSLLATSLPPLTFSPAYAAETPAPPDSGLYRTHVVLDSPSRRARLQSLGVVVLHEDPGSALVLADDLQLETLARLRFQPRTSDELGSLLPAAGAAQAWLTRSLQPLLQQGIALQSLMATDAEATTIDSARRELRDALAAMTVEQRAGVAQLVSPDEDLDGLTNTEEAWWCTDYQNPNSDGDAQGYTDGQEVDALLDFTQPRSVRWGYGPPFGPPNAWPNFNDRLGTHANVCNDGDWDTIPDYAETRVVGSRVPNETTDGDKFDDGQELFGVTYCPGAPTNCGYGSFPAIEYWNYIKATMPNWVRPPGDNLFVAAFPVPEVSVVPGSWTVTRVTTITTTQGQMTQTTSSYETSATRGQSTSIADTRTWNNWEEVSQSLETPVGENSLVYAPAKAPEDFWQRAWGAARVAGGVTGGVVFGALGAMGAVACVPSGGLGCVGAGAAGVAVVGSLAVAGQGWQALWGPDQVQEQQQANHYIINRTSIHTTNNMVVPVILNQNFDTQGIVSSLDGIQYAINHQGELLSNGLHDISYQLSRPRFTETHTSGHSWGGAQTITNEVYEEHTITQGQAFTTGENWSTAWAVDSSHAADLTFTYTIKNTGTEYARELTGVIFNIYLGDDKTPIISYPAWQQFPNGKIENLFPSDPPHQFAANPVPLSLDQMRRIDLGEPLRVVLEDFSYGADELFYEDAIAGGMTVFIEDGVDDGDELVDSYVVPTWGQESVQDALTRYFPAGYDLDGNLNSLWTPEFNGINPPVWYEHFLSDIAWWNIYLTQADAGSTPLKDLPAEAGGAILFRFNRDADRDGYQDRVELRYGTDKDDPADHPQPEILAGYVKEQTGNVVTVKLVLENSGTFDAYGIDAVMISPDDTTTIGNNTVGGNGKVRPGQHVAVGSLVKQPGLGQWGSSTAKPYSAGSYSGSTDRTYTFSAATPGVVGTGSTTLNWNDGAGGTGTLQVGGSYHSPLPLPVSNGLEVGLTTGTIAASASFTVTALTPRDTFTYTVDGPTYTEPVIVVSYSDPQGSHRFVTPVELPSLDSDLAPYAGQMLKPIELSIATTSAVAAGSDNTTHLVVNSPHPATIQDGHLYVDFVADGELVAHQEHTLDIPPGPTVFPVIWSTATFTQTFDPAADNILLVHWTDSEGNIIDSAARPLNTFAVDPMPAFAMVAADATWDFGTAKKDTLLQKHVTVANIGSRDLIIALNHPSSMAVEGPLTRMIAPGDMTVVTVTLSTESLPVGPYQDTLLIRTSDPAIPIQTVSVQGTITPIEQWTEVSPSVHPLDWTVPLSGTYTQGDLIEFEHDLQPDPATLHPVRVFDSDYQLLLGRGKYNSWLSVPEPRSMAGLVYDVARHRMILFGGWNGVHYFGDTWENNGFLWQPVQTVQGPAPRIGMGMVYDYANQRVVLFGGGDGTNVYGDTWHYEGMNWVQVTPNTSPSARIGPGMTYDTTRHKLVLFGGKSASGSFLADTWEYSDGQWQQIFPVHSPSARGGGQILTYDSQRHRVIAHGGVVSDGNTWEYDGTDWVLRAQGPNYYWPQEMTYLEDSSKVLLNYGGSYRSYEYEPVSATWHQVSTNSTPWDGSSLTYDPINHKAVLFGGYIQTDRTPPVYNNDVWLYDPGSHTWQQQVPTNDYIVEQVETPPYTTTRLKIPETFSGERTYQVEYARRLIFGQASELVTELRVPVGPHWDVSFDAMVRDVGSGSLTLKLDIGNNGTWELETTQLVTNTATFANIPLTTAFNDYWQAIGQPNTGTMDVAVRVALNKAGQVFLANLQLKPSTIRYARVSSRLYDHVTATISVGDSGSATQFVAADVGDDGNIDWVYSSATSFPATLTTSNLATACNAYLAGHSGEVDVPIRFYMAPVNTLHLARFSAAPAVQSDARVGNEDLALSATTIMETDPVTVTAMIHNDGTYDTGGLTATAYAAMPSGSDTLIGAAYIPNVPANGTATTSITWDTTGFTGTVPVRVVIDPYNRLAETNETNNEATANLTILTRPDLQTTQLVLSNPEPVTDETVDVTIGVHNAGQTTAGAQVVALYDGNPAAGGTLLGSQNLAPLPGSTTVDVVFPWTPTAAGAHRLFARLDRDDQVNESDETNNDTWQDVYIGFRGPHLLDSGSTAADPPYSTALGYGYLNGDASTFCGTRPDVSQRSAPEGEVRYRFDHLLPGHYYHLDITLFECDGAGRVEVIRVDDNQVGSAVDLTDSVVHRVSILLDPAFYADYGITVGISETIGYDAVVARINLHDVDYRYSDAGRSNNPVDPNDPAYPYASPGRPARLYGYVDGVDNRPWGTLPYQSRRIDLADSNPLDDPDNELRYQFDGLDVSKRYRLNLTFFQNAGGATIQTVYADDFDTGVTVTLNGQQRVDRAAEIPASAYVGDGSTVVRIVRTNALANAFVNVLALEEITSLCDAPDLSCDGRVTVADIVLAAQGWSAGEMTIVDVQTVAASFQP